MKKYLFFALAAAGMLSSCSSDDIASNGKSIDNSDLVPIRIGIGQSVSATRGTGTVGGFDDDTDNKWAGQQVRVYMLDSAKMSFALDAEKNIAFRNSLFDTPNGRNDDGHNVGDVPATPVDQSIKYYNPMDVFDFWGYRLDDAVTSNLVEGDDAITIDFTIDGSQDVMVAKAVPDSQDTIKLRDAGNEKADRAFSAFAARHEVNPNLHFRHLLSRLTFTVIPGTDEAIDPTSPVVVDSIYVVSRNKGTLYIASINDKKGETQRIEWEELGANPDSLKLKQRGASATAADNLEDFTSVDLSDLSQYIDPSDKRSGRAIGEALLVAPDVDKYRIKIFLHQDMLKSLDPAATPEIIKYDYETWIPAPDAQTFKEGNSYNVKITLYGLSDIKVYTTLEKWVDGGEIELYPEDEQRSTDEDADNTNDSGNDPGNDPGNNPTPEP